MDMAPCVRAIPTLLLLLLLLVTLVDKEPADTGANTNAEPDVVQAHKVATTTAIIEVFFMIVRKSLREYVWISLQSTNN